MEHPLSSNEASALEALRSEAERLTEQAFTEGLERLCESEQVRLYELWHIFPELKQEFEEMNGFVRTVKSVYAPEKALHGDDWESLESRIFARVQANTASSRTSHSEKGHSGVKHPALTFIASVKRHAPVISRIAAVFVIGVLVGKFLMPFHARTNAEFASHVKETSKENVSIEHVAMRQAELKNYLNDAHLLMLGVMAMNAECGIANPHTLTSQRERCVELLARSSRVQAGLSGEERQRMAFVLSEVESALAELADVQPASCNTMKIRQLQERTDYALCEVSNVLQEQIVH